MAKLQIPLDDNLMMEAKLFALKNNTSLKEVVIKALQTYIGGEPIKSTPKTKKEKLVETPRPVAPLVPRQTPKPSLFDTVKQKPMIVEETKGVSPAITGTDDDDQTAGGLFHLIPKTAKVGKALTRMKQFHEGPVSWMIVEGCKPHFDKNGNPIPFRMTDSDGKVWEPDLEEINELSEYYGKPVVLEE